MAIQQLYLFLSVALLSSCALIVDPLENNLPPLQKIEKPKIGSLLVPGLANIKANNKVKPVVAIYTGCLLYTSPSPRDGLLSRMPSSA